MRGFFFHEATDRLMQSYLSPYFLIPVVIVVTVSLLDPFEITCTTGLSGVQSAFLSATFAVCLISAFAGGRFFSVFWNRRDTGTGQQSASRQTPTGQGREE